MTNIEKLSLNSEQFYIDGKWVNPASSIKKLNVTNPSNESTVCQISLGSGDDVDLAVSAANNALVEWKKTSIETRRNLLKNLREQYKLHIDDMALAISTEMGAPISMAKSQHAASGLAHIETFIEELDSFDFNHSLKGDTQQHIMYQPIGVCGLITPWNWPINQLALKVIPALAVGCTVVLKPSEISPLSAMLLAKIIDKAGYPKGVFNLVNGNGEDVGSAISSHKNIQMVSFTGSTRAGIAVMKSGADTVKKVTLELGGKSPNLVFADADLENAIQQGVANCFGNTGQTCVAPTRMLVEQSVYDKAVLMAKEFASNTTVDHSDKEGGHIGPLSSLAQFNRVQAMIEKGIKEGATLEVGGLGKPDGFDKGYFVKPTIFSQVDNQMSIAQEEIFGPVLVMIPFKDEEDAITLANDTPYGLNARIQTRDIEKARRVAQQLDAGMIQINGIALKRGIPFGGLKQSGIGREGGKWGIEDYLEVKAISGWES